MTETIAELDEVTAANSTETRLAPDEAAPPPAAPPDHPTALGYGLALAALLALMITFRLVGPSDLHDHEQPRTAALSVDAATNGGWPIPRSADGALATQPPMTAWWGAAAIRATGRTDEWVLKLPALLAAAITVIVVVVTARPYVGAAAACVAAAVWLANPLVFELLYSARPDMLLAMWLAIATLAAVRQRERWRWSQEGAARSSRFSLLCPLLWPALFWLAIAGGLLTAGPAMLIAVVFLLGLVVHDGAWRRARPALQGATAAAGMGLVGWWGYAVLQAAPQGWETLIAMWLPSVTASGEAQRLLQTWELPLHFLTRWLPWSVAFGLGAILLLVRARGRGGSPRLGWTVAMVAIVVGAYMFQSGGRGGDVLPACAAATILVAGLFAWATGQGGVFRVLTHLLLGLVGAVGLACSILVWLAPRPGLVTWAEHAFVDPPTGPDYDRLVWVTAGVAIAAGLATQALIHRRNYLGGAMAACFVVAGALGFFDLTWGRAGTDRTGDTVVVLVDAARAVAAADGSPVIAYGTSNTPVPALLGQAEPADAAALERLGDAGGVVITTGEAWAEAPEPWRGRGRLVARTPELSVSGVQLLLIRVAE